MSNTLLPKHQADKMTCSLRFTTTRHQRYITVSCEIRVLFSLLLDGHLGT